MNKILTLTKKELNYFLNSNLGYVVVVPFLFISFFLYFRTTFVFGTASLRPFFELLPWFLIFLAPAITMQTLSEEKNKKTLELLIAHPLSEFQIVISKFLAVFVFYLIILATTLPLAIPLFLFSKIDIGILISQYLGAAFTGATFLSIGIFASSLTASLISSFLVGGAVSFLLTLIGLDFVTLSLPQPFGSLVSYLSIGFHNQSISRGLLDFSDLLYFITACAFFLILAVFKISESKISERPAEKSKLYASLTTTIVVGILLNIVTGIYPLRVDLTTNKLFSLSPATKEIVSKIDDILSIKTFISPDLPPSMQNIAREVKDTLKDYGRYSQKIKLEYQSPTAGSDSEKQAQNLGIFPVRFNTIGSSSYQLQNGYLGIALRFGDKTETLPFIQNTSDLEYQLTRKINKIVSKTQKNILIFSGNETQTAQSPGQNDLQFGKLSTILTSQYNVQTTNLDKSFENQKTDLLVIAGVKKPLDNQTVEEVKRYLDSGGKVLFLLDKILNDPSSITAASKTTGLENLLAGYGVTLNSDLVYDPALAETIQFSRGQMGFLIPYPFWFKALPSDPKFPPTSQVRSVTLLWPSSLTLVQKEDFKTMTVLKTSKNAGLLSGPSFNISPEKLNELDFKPGGQEIPLAALVTRKSSEAVLGVVADSKFASDNYYSPNNQNLPFTTGLVDYLALGPKELVPIKNQSENFFVFSAPWQPSVVQWGETVGVPLIVALFAAAKLWKRRNEFNRVYDQL